MSTDQVSLVAEVQAVPPLPVDYDMEAASQPKLPPRSQDELVFHGTSKSDPERKNSCRTLYYVIFVLFAMAATGAAVWFVMDSSSQTKSIPNTQANDQPQQSGDFSSTLPPAPAPSPPTGPPLEMSDTKPLSMCMGDCDEDSDCGPGLMCFQRSKNIPVPGCSGGLEDNSNTDYCISAEQPSLVITEKFRLGICEGDCFLGFIQIVIPMTTVNTVWFAINDLNMNTSLDALGVLPMPADLTIVFLAPSFPPPT